MRARRLTLSVVLLLLWSASAWAQTAQTAPSWDAIQSRVTPGDAVFVTDRQGREIAGVLRRLSPTSIVIVLNGAEREILVADVGRIEKRGDSLKNGAGIDALHSGRTTVYTPTVGTTTVHMAPLISPERGGVLVSVKF